MNFTSALFLIIFLPVTVLLYYSLPVRLRSVWMCFVSFVFYAWGGLSYALLIISLTVVNYILGVLVRNKAKNKRYLILSIIINLGVLGFFKYFNFFNENISIIMKLIQPDFEIVPMNIPLPIGISFFTFKIISYIVDTYKGEIKANNNFITLATYILFFPQLLSGPIDRFNNISSQLNSKFSWERIHNGLTRFVLGLGKKVIIANTLGEAANFSFDNLNNLNTVTAWTGIVCYSLQIYFDFSGYSDMAIGLGKIFGIDFMENFNYPYISKSIQEFWRRWHISLSTWFKDYVYIPLGGNRKGIARTYFNLITVFFLTGLWHGAAWNFVLWGMFHGVFQILERIGLNKIMKKIPAIFSYSYTLFVVMIGWVLFRAANLSDAISYIKMMFDLDITGWEKVLLQVDYRILFVIILAVIFSMPASTKIKEIAKKLEEKKNGIVIVALKEIGLVLLYLICLSYISGSNYNAFIYFRF